MIRISGIPEDKIYGLETTLGDHVITEKIPETVSDEGIRYFTIILDEEIVIVKVLFGNITIDVGGRLFTLLNKDYNLMVVV